LWLFPICVSNGSIRTNLTNFGPSALEFWGPGDKTLMGGGAPFFGRDSSEERRAEIYYLRGAQKKLGGEFFAPPGGPTVLVLWAPNLKYPHKGGFFGATPLWESHKEKSRATFEDLTRFPTLPVGKHHMAARCPLFWTHQGENTQKRGSPPTKFWARGATPISPLLGGDKRCMGAAEKNPGGEHLGKTPRGGLINIAPGRQKISSRGIWCAPPQGGLWAPPPEKN